MKVKKKVIIFTCTGGHTTAAQAVSEYLSDGYDVVTLNMFSDVLVRADLVRWLTFFKYGSEDIYNWFLKNRKYRFINTWLLKAHAYYRWISKRVFYLIDKAIKAENPDLIISVIPLFNGHILQSASSQDKPFFLIPTDVDVTTFFEGICKPTYKNFYVGLMIDNQVSRAMLEKVGINKDAVHVVGPLLRADFFQPKDIAAIRRAYGILPAKRVVLLAMGSQGSVTMVSFCTMIAQVTIPLHLIIVLGKNTQLRSAIESIQFSRLISITILDFTTRMSDLMAVSDLLITKSGGMSVMEGIGMHLPMMLDATSEVIIWEQANQDLVIRRELGVAIKKVEHIKSYIEIALHTDEIEKYHAHFARLFLRIAPHEIQNLVKTILNKEPVQIGARQPSSPAQNKLSYSQQERSL